MSQTPDVLIVGYGPVGAMTALQLTHAGLSVEIVDRRSGILDIPRAVGIDGESMRSFQRLGLVERVDAVVQPRRPREEFCFTDSKRQRLFGLELPPRGPMGWREAAFFDQPQLEAVLRETVEARDDISVREEFEVESIEWDASGVRVRGADGHLLEAAWLIGCDGASSTVRAAIGSEWESLGYDQDWLVIDVVMGPDAELPLTMMQVCDPERLTTYIPGRDPFRRWEFAVVDGDDREAMTRPETVAALLEPWIAPEHYELRRAAVYQFHAATASRWREGRVLLAGDAAHQTPPFLGQGLNSGFRDAVNLGWTLPLVHAGVCEPGLLDHYQAERGPHSHDLVDRAVGIGQLMETLAAREAGRPDPYAEAASRAAPPDGQLVPPIRAGTLVAEQIAEGSPVGRLLYQPTVRDAEGTSDRLDRWLGEGFAVVGRNAGALELDERSQAVLDRLGAARIALDGLTTVEGEADRLFESHEAAIIRPDRIVFGVVDEAHSLDALCARLARSLGLRDRP